MNREEAKFVNEYIYFCKMEELQMLLKSGNLSVAGKKQELIDRILRRVFGKQKSLAKKSTQKINQDQDPETFIVQGIYTNGSHARSKLKKLIGEHFKFTIYGMEWIKAQWRLGKNPSYQEFAEYWQGEFERRKSGGSFSSPKTLARVNFFRQMKKSRPGITKAKLESEWKQTRSRSAKRVISIVSKALKS